MSLTLSGSGTIGGLVAGGLPDATVTSADLAANAVDSQTLTLLNASGSAPIYACRAWVNFNGTGTVAIRASGNVSSITDNGTGDYTVNFTTAMPDANYSPNMSVKTLDLSSNNVSACLHPFSDIGSTGFRIRIQQANGLIIDCSVVSCDVFR